MPNCTRCGEWNADGATLCGKCGVTLAHQLRAKADVQRTRNVQMLNIVIKIGVVVALVILAPIGYRLGYGAFLKFQLTNAKQSALKECGGPALAETPQAQKDQIDQCMTTNPELVKAQAAYDRVTKG